MKTYLGFIRDHSGSMGRITTAAAADYNSSLLSAGQASKQHNINTVVSVVECGGGYQFVQRLVPVDKLVPLKPHEYKAPGHNTPLFDSVGALIASFESVPDFDSPDVNFLIIATTDGQDNVSGVTGGRRIANKIKQLQSTDRWTVVFRVPHGYARDLVSLGIDAGNILEWEQTERGVQHASAQTTSAMSDFYAGTSRGVRSTKTFYTSTANVTEADVQKLGDISAEVSFWSVGAADSGRQIRDFVEGRLADGKPMLKGSAFYQLVKAEDKIQDYKLVVIRDKDTGAVYCGPEARDLIGLPRYGDARVKPDTTGKWQVFIQSTSVNRKVTGGSTILYWPNVGVRYKEGKSAR